MAGSTKPTSFGQVTGVKQSSDSRPTSTTRSMISYASKLSSTSRLHRRFGMEKSKSKEQNRDRRISCIMQASKLKGLGKNLDKSNITKMSRNQPAPANKLRRQKTIEFNKPKPRRPKKTNDLDSDSGSKSNLGSTENAFEKMITKQRKARQSRSIKSRKHESVGSKSSEHRSDGGSLDISGVIFGD